MVGCDECDRSEVPAGGQRVQTVPLTGHRTHQVIRLFSSQTHIVTDNEYIVYGYVNSVL